MNYTHLTQDERYQIYILLKAGHNPSEIARAMNRDKSCISRELRRNRGERGYRPQQAHAVSQARLQGRARPRVADDTWVFVETKLAETWSPEQITGYLKAHGEPPVSHESIYQRIYADKRAGGALHHTLRCQKPAGSATGAATGVAAFPIKCRLSNVRPSSIREPASATGRVTW